MRQKRNRLTDTENELVVTSGEGRELQYRGRGLWYNDYMSKINKLQGMYCANTGI